MGFKRVTTTQGTRRLRMQGAAAMTLNGSGKKIGNEKVFQLSINLSPGLMAAMRWQKGDRIDVLVDDENSLRILLKRVVSGGWALSGGGGTSAKSNIGRIQMTRPKEVGISQGQKLSSDSFKEFDGGVLLDFSTGIHCGEPARSE